MKLNLYLFFYIIQDNLILPLRWHKNDYESRYFERQKNYKIGVWFEYYRKKVIKVYKEKWFLIDPVNGYPVFRIFSCGPLRADVFTFTESKAFSQGNKAENGYWASKQTKGYKKFFYCIIML